MQPDHVQVRAASLPDTLRHFPRALGGGLCVLVLPDSHGGGPYDVGSRRGSGHVSNSFHWVGVFPWDRVPPGILVRFNRICLGVLELDSGAAARPRDSRALLTSRHPTIPSHHTLRCPQFTGYGSQFVVTSYYFYLFAFLGRHRWVVHAHDLPEGHTQFVQTLSAFSVLIMFFSCFFYARGFDQWRVPEP